MTTEMHPDVKIGHIHLRVADLERATKFYRNILGFKIIADGASYGLPLVLLAAGTYHHHIALNTFVSKDGSPAPTGHTGLHHFALLYPNRHEFLRAVQRLVDHKYPIDDAKDHGATISVYLSDPDSNGIELFYDLPRETWFDESGSPVLKNESINLQDLLAELPSKRD